MKHLLELAKSCPDLSVTVRLADLLEAGRCIVREAREEAAAEERARRAQYGDGLVPKEEARRLLGGPDPTTLWRWEKRGYLAPVKIGDRVFYRESAISALINKKTINS